MVAHVPRVEETGVMSGLDRGLGDDLLRKVVMEVGDLHGMETREGFPEALLGSRCPGGCRRAGWRPDPAEFS